MRKGRRSQIVLAVALVAPMVAGCAGAPSAPPTRSARPSGSPMRVEGTWAASSGRQVGVYFILSNAGSADDALTGAGSPAASGAILKDGPHPIARLPLPAGSQVSFDGSRYTLTLVGLRRRVTSGDTIHVTLTFSHDPSVAFVAGVR